VTKLALRGAIGSEAAAKVSAYRAFRTELRAAFSEYAGAYVSIDVLLSWGTTRFAAVPVRHDARAEGRSSYTFGRLATHALNVLTGFSTRPLRIASIVGLAFTGLGVVLLALVVVRYFVNGRDVVPGFPFLASMIAIFSGVQLLTLGIIGEYLARMHIRVMDRPAYTVRDEVGE
jgi:undecaprenyl-phosphate 4-deoxy-4-formamido-L-arabinose transferase